MQGAMLLFLFKALPSFDSPVYKMDHSRHLSQIYSLKLILCNLVLVVEIFDVAREYLIQRL